MEFDGKAVPEGMDAGAVKQLLTRGWMTHDGMWFAAVLAAHGIEEANRLNLTAIRAMASIEVKRLKKALGIDDFSSEEAARRLFIDGISLLVGDYMEFTWDWRPGCLSMEMGRCFAHQGMEALGCADGYQCGIFVRILAWLDALGVTHEVEPADTRCLMHHFGSCRKTVRYRLPG